MPYIWLTVAQKGVKLKFRVPQNQILGVPQGQAALAGVLIGIIVFVALTLFFSEPWIIAIAAITYGLAAQFPGAYTIKVWRRMREVIGG